MDIYDDFAELTDDKCFDDCSLESELGSNILEELYYRNDYFSIKVDDVISGCDW